MFLPFPCLPLSRISAKYKAIKVSIVTCDVYAFVEATAISGPACVYIE